MVLKYILKFYLKNALKSLTSITDGNLDRIMLRDFLIKINTDLDVITHISAIEIRLFIYSKIKHNLGAIFAKYSEKRQLELLSDKNNDLEKKLTDITNLKKTQKEEQLEKKQTEELEYITKITAIIEAICAKLQLSPGTIKTICITPTQEITPVCDSTATSNFKQYVKTLFKN